MKEIEPPPASGLSGPPSKGRFHPNQFNDGSLRDKSIYSDQLSLPDVTPREIVRRAARAVESQGFSEVGEEPPWVAGRRHLQAHEGVVLGNVVMERNLRLDERRTRRWDRARWAVMGMGVPIFGLGVSNLLLGTPHLPIGLDASLGLVFVGSGMLALPLATIGDADFWSDLAVVKFEAVEPTLIEKGPMLDFRGAYRVDVAVGRALTENWQSKVEKGRSVKTLVSDSSTEPSRLDLLKGLSATGDDSSSRPLKA
jgi:hypothetical protein